MNRQKEVVKENSEGESCKCVSPLDQQERVRSGRLVPGWRALALDSAGSLLAPDHGQRFPCPWPAERCSRLEPDRRDGRRAAPSTGGPVGQYADIETKLPSFVLPAPGDSPSLTTP